MGAARLSLAVHGRAQLPWPDLPRSVTPGLVSVQFVCLWPDQSVPRPWLISPAPFPLSCASAAGPDKGKIPLWVLLALLPP